MSQHRKLRPKPPKDGARREAESREAAKRTVKKPARKNSPSKTHRQAGAATRTRADARGVVSPPCEIHEGAPTVVSVRYAKANLSSLLQRVLGGERVQIAVADQGPRFELVPLEARADTRGSPRQFGSLRGAVTMNERFFEPLPTDELDAWER